MAQHDYNIENGTGAEVRADINNALSAIKTLNSGDTAPTSPAEGMLWLDTSNNDYHYLKIYTGGAWRSVAKIDVNNANVTLISSNTDVTDALSDKVDKKTITANHLITTDGNRGIAESPIFYNDGNLKTGGRALQLADGKRVALDNGLTLEADGDIYFKILGNNKFKFSNSGKTYCEGIILNNGLQWDANKNLNHYEEGSFDCQFYGKDGGSITMQRARYTRIGRLVFVTAQYWGADFTSLQGELRISLPFPIGDADFISGSILLDLATTSKRPLGIWGVAWNTYAMVRAEQRIGIATTADDLPDNGHVYFSMVYHTY